MRRPSNVPAVQLGSVALRYHWPQRQASGRWWTFGLPANPADAEAPPNEVPQAAFQRDAKLQRLEAVLLLAREPLNSRKLAEHASLADGTEARTLVRRLNAMYDGAGRAFRVEEVAGGFQLLSRRKFAAWLRRLDHVPGELRLSAPAVETLAVIAYRQPVLRADIEAIRGVNCGEILRQLMERDLVRISGRSEELGRPYLYATTRKFLQIFGLPNIDKLPRVETMRSIPAQDVNAREESEVSVTSQIELSVEESFEAAGRLASLAIAAQAKDDDDDYEDEDEEFDDEDEDVDDEDEDEDFEEDEEEYEDEEFDEEDDEDESDEGFEDEEWEEVDDDEEEDDEEWDEEDDEDLDWEDEDEDDEELDDEEEWE